MISDREDVVCITPQEYSVEIALVYATSNNPLGRQLYSDPSGCYLHKDAAVCLKKAAAIADSEGYKLKVLDALRPLEAQRILWDAFKGPDEIIALKPLALKPLDLEPLDLEPLVPLQLIRQDAFRRHRSFSIECEGVEGVDRAHGSDPTAFKDAFRRHRSFSIECEGVEGVATEHGSDPTAFKDAFRRHRSFSTGHEGVATEHGACPTAAKDAFRRHRSCSTEYQEFDIAPESIPLVVRMRGSAPVDCMKAEFAYHCRGIGVSVTLVDKQTNKELDMETPVVDGEGAGGEQQIVQGNRAKLRKIMIHGGFQAMPGDGEYGIFHLDNYNEKYSLIRDSAILVPVVPPVPEAVQGIQLEAQGGRALGGF